MDTLLNEARATQLKDIILSLTRHLKEIPEQIESFNERVEALTDNSLREKLTTLSREARVRQMVFCDEELHEMCNFNFHELACDLLATERSSSAQARLVEEEALQRKDAGTRGLSEADALVRQWEQIHNYLVKAVPPDSQAAGANYASMWFTFKSQPDRQQVMAAAQSAFAIVTNAIDTREDLRSLHSFWEDHLDYFRSQTLGAVLLDRPKGDKGALLRAWEGLRDLYRGLHGSIAGAEHALVYTDPAIPVPDYAQRP